jgi:GT2 family glycosyltransferase
MIHILFVIYNSSFALKEGFEGLDGFVIHVFDNSDKENYLKANKEYTSSHKIDYIFHGKNLGLSKAYNEVITSRLGKDDWLLILDADTSISLAYLQSLKDAVLTKKALVFTPINIDKATGIIDTPKRIECHRLFLCKEVTDTTYPLDYYMSINNGLLVHSSVFEKMGGYDERLFLYFTDSYFFFRLYQLGIKTAVIPYRNECDFSFRTATKDQLTRKLRLMKRDAAQFYKIIYYELHRPLLAWVHKAIFNVRKAKECAHFTKKRYFLHYLLVRKAK